MRGRTEGFAPFLLSAFCDAVVHMAFETHIALFLVVELLDALRANDPDTFKQWIAVVGADRGEPAIAELLIDWFNPLLTQEEADRFVGWHLGVSL